MPLRIGVSILLWLLTGHCLAEDPLRYEVELVLFENTDPTALRAEHWPDSVPTPDYEDAVELPPPGVRGKFEALPNDAKDLSGAASLLNKSDHYTVVAHLAWEQPGLPSETAKPILLRAGKDYGIEFPELMQPRLEFDAEGNLVEIEPPERLDEVEGTVRVVLGRYLHVYTDLVFRKPVTVMEYNETADMLVPMQRLQTIPVREWRRMRSRELHYVDHPVLGMLIRITPVTPPERGGGNASQGSPLGQAESNS